MVVSDKEEVTAGPQNPSRVANELVSYIEFHARASVERGVGHDDVETAIENTKTATRRFAKRQLSWLRKQREGHLEWVLPAEKGGAACVEALWSDHLAAAGQREGERGKRGT